MEFKRLKSIDIFRGLCMAWMVLNHIVNWWINSEFSWLHSITIMIIDPIGASGFLFISGVSIALSYRKRMKRTIESQDYNYRIIRNSYLFRAFFLFIIAIIYNIPMWIVFNDPRMIWIWFVLLTAAVSLFLAWPLLKTLKYVRIIIAILIIILHLFLVSKLLPFEGESNVFGLIFHILYNGITQDPILIFFPFFLIGTVFGDILYDIINTPDNLKLKKTLLYLLTIGSLLIILGISLNFPKFLNRESLSWIIYSIGIDIAFLSILLLIERTGTMETKKSYKFIFYYSYYSLTIYLSHNILYFLFLNQLDLISIWFFVAGSFISIGLVFRAIYKKWENKASIKAQIGRLSLRISMNIEEIKKKKNETSNLK
ncbi:MAG: acyltransferase family protein [Candidatus Hermodarchaeota archaeon]